MKVHKVTLIITDHDDVGAKDVSDLIEMQNYPNHCISPIVSKIETKEVDWSEDHPLNMKGWEVFFDLMFSPPKCKICGAENPALLGVDGDYICASCWRKQFKKCTEGD